MKKLLSKYLEIYALVTAIACGIILIGRENMSKSRKWAAFLLFISCIHAWDESKWSGGYFDLILNKFGMKGKHPANVCLNAKDGKPSCHGCGGACHKSAQGDDAALVAEITKRVMEQLGK